MTKKFEITLSDRKKEILLSAVESYIDNALPITSEKVQNTIFSNLSSATLRNELSALEEMGYLKQLHTSSGRVPTTKAYRYFVDNLLSSGSIVPKDVDMVKDKFVRRSAFILDIVDDIAKSVGKIVDYPTFVTLSGYDKLLIEQVNIIPLITGQALLLIKTNGGIINNTITLKDNVGEENCKDASKFLTTNLMNKKICDVLNNFDEYQKLFENQIKYFQDFFVQLTTLLKAYVDGGTHILNHGNTTKMLESPEYKDLDSAKKFINLVENEQVIKDAIANIDENTKSDIVFSIGEENEDKDLNDYSIVKANYTLNSGIVASIGVVGPQRLDYAKIAGALKYVCDEIREINDNKEDVDGKK